MIWFMLKNGKFRLIRLLIKARIKSRMLRVRSNFYWYLWNRCDAYDGSKLLSRANFILCAWLSKLLGAGDYWLNSNDYSDMRLFKGGL